MNQRSVKEGGASQGRLELAVMHFPSWQYLTRIAPTVLQSQCDSDLHKLLTRRIFLWTEMEMGKLTARVRTHAHTQIFPQSI